MKKRISMLGVICLALMLVAMPFVACGEPEAPPPAAPTVITPTPAVVTPSPGLPPTPTVPVVPTTPAGPAKPVTPAPAPVVIAAPAGEPVYTVMDPRGAVVPIPYIGLAPRLDTVVGKKIGVVNMMGGNEAVMDSLPADIMAAYPGCTAELLYMKDSKSSEAWEFVESCDAIILGHNY